MNVIFGNTTLTEQRLDALSRHISDWKESIQFMQDGIDKKNAFNQKKQGFETDLNEIKEKNSCNGIMDD